MLKNLSPKGEKIFASMKKQYGVKKAMEVFTNMESEKKISGGRLEVKAKKPARKGRVV